MASEETTGIALLADNVGSEMATLKRAERIRKINRRRKKIDTKIIQIHREADRN